MLLFINTSTPGFPVFAPGVAPVTGLVGTLTNLQCCDLDSDGDDEVLATDSVNQTLRIWENCVAQGCPPMAPLASPQVTNLNLAPFVGGVVNSMVCCDMSQSSAGPDIAVSQFAAGNSTVTVMLNYGGITSFQDNVISTLTGSGGVQVTGAVATMLCCDMDGVLGSDLVLGSGTTISALLSNGATMPPSGPQSIGTMPGPILGMDCCDLETDGTVDIIASSGALTNSLQVVPGLFGSPTPLMPQPAGLVIDPLCCDVDNDGDPEIIVDQVNGAAINYVTLVNQTIGPSALTYPGTGSPLSITSGVSPTGAMVALTGGPLNDIKSITNNDTLFINLTDAGGGSAGPMILVIAFFTTSIAPTNSLGFWTAGSPQLFTLGPVSQTFSAQIPAVPVLSVFSLLAQGYAIPAQNSVTTTEAHEFQLR